MIKLSVAIMHCSDTEERKQLLQKILLKINKNLLESLEIVDDSNRNGIWWNYKRALLAKPNNVTHHIVLQDDMMPCDNFVETILQIINKLPNEVIHYFASSDHYKNILDDGYNIFIAEGGIWGGSVVLPQKHFEWYKWVEKYFNNASIGKHFDDERMSLYFEFNKILVYCITPGLTEHLGNNSLIGNPEGRFAKTFITDGLSIDWNNKNYIPNAGYIWGYSLKDIKKHINREVREEFIKKYAGGTIKTFFKQLKETRKKQYNK